MRQSKTITNAQDLEEILSIKEEDITLSFFMEMFGEFNEKCKYNPYDTFTVPKGTFGKEKKNKNSFTTTIGIWIWNKYFIENHIPELYINETIDDGRWEDLMDEVSRRVLEDELPLETIDALLLRAQKVMPLCSVLTPSITDKFLKASTVCEVKKKELAKKYAKEIEDGNVEIADAMEKELMAYAKEYLKDDPSMDLYDSGARSSFKNHFKNMYLMKGAIANPDPNAEKQFNIALSCYNNGISKEEYGLFCNSLAAGPYARSRKTATGGYWEKLFLTGYQHLSRGPKGSDCGTKDTLKVYLTDKNISGWMYSYVVDHGQLVELNSKTYKKYLNKEVNIRFSALCEYKDHGCICNACLGNLFYRQGTENVGIAVKDIASILKNKSMKAFHDSTVQLSVMDVKKAFGE